MMVSICVNPQKSAKQMIVFGSNHPMIPMINGHVPASGTPTSFCRIAFSPWPSSGFLTEDWA